MLQYVYDWPNSDPFILKCFNIYKEFEQLQIFESNLAVT